MQTICPITATKHGNTTCFVITEFSLILQTLCYFLEHVSNVPSHLEDLYFKGALIHVIVNIQQTIQYATVVQHFQRVLIEPIVATTLIHSFSYMLNTTSICCILSVLASRQLHYRLPLQFYQTLSKTCIGSRDIYWASLHINVTLKQSWIFTALEDKSVINLNLNYSGVQFTSNPLHSLVLTAMH